MSCWVAATVAAELWGITVKEVLERVHRGEVTSQTDLGFLVVDVAPHAPKGLGPQPQPGGHGVHIRPNTYRYVEMLSPGCISGASASHDDEPLGWQERRRLVGATRRRPR